MKDPPPPTKPLRPEHEERDPSERGRAGSTARARATSLCKTKSTKVAAGETAAA